ncbi:MAG: family acetyltransferase [Clostridia bacterium]|jgi:predicted acetyltransferase|nr:family acetyltransferase [Clostridia bacterium]
MSARLIKPTIELEHAYLDMIKEWKAQEDKLIPWVLGFDASDFPELIQKLENCSKGIGLSEGMVEHSTYWLVNEDNRVVGAVNIRHSLNEKLLHNGGHIGYGIRPSERRKGNASEALRQALNIARSMGTYSALVVCDKNNVGSAKTIQKNGGILENEIEKDGEITQRYWIDIE